MWAILNRGYYHYPYSIPIQIPVRGLVRLTRCRLSAPPSHLAASASHPLRVRPSLAASCPVGAYRGGCGCEPLRGVYTLFQKAEQVDAAVGPEIVSKQR